MADDRTDPQPLARPVKEANWALRGVLLLTLLALLGIAYVFGTTVVPRWWAHRVGDRVDGSLTAGAFYGLFVGFVFSLLALLIARQAVRRMPWRLRALILVLALTAAAPNLMTLSIVLGSGNGAHAGDRILDTEGDGFRAGSLWGAATAVVVAAGLLAWAWKWRRDRRQLKSLRSERNQARRVVEPPAQDES